VLSDPENSSRTAEEVADLVIGALDDVRARTHRLAVVGQIAFPEAPETTHTVVLGPFSSRGILDTREKFLKAVAGPSRARTVGQDLVADPKTGRGLGRFVLAPAFQRPRDAYDFYRAEEWRDRIPKERLENIQASVTRWEAGLWATEVAPGPVCHCGTHTERTLATSAGAVEPGPCPVHGRRGE
jgi:hypothetical protein